jgi:hypothetical protein
VLQNKEKETITPNFLVHKLFTNARHHYLLGTQSSAFGEKTGLSVPAFAASRALS